MKDRDALDLVSEWLACNRADLHVVELAHLAGTRCTWRATLRTALGRTASQIGISPAAALRASYGELGYIEWGDGTLAIEASLTPIDNRRRSA